MKWGHSGKPLKVVIWNPRKRLIKDGRRSAGAGTNDRGNKWSSTTKLLCSMSKQDKTERPLSFSISAILSELSSAERKGAMKRINLLPGTALGSGLS